MCHLTKKNQESILNILEYPIYYWPYLRTMAKNIMKPSKHVKKRLVFIILYQN